MLSPAAPPGQRHAPRRALARGTALLEALVALLVLSIGILGLLGVQLRNLAEMQTSVHRAQAVRLIEDLAERLRTHPDGLAQLRQGRYAGDWDAASPASTDLCDTTACTPAELALWDVMRWRHAVARTLPKGRANLFLPADEAADPGNRRQLGVMLGWRANERDGGDAAYTRPFQIDIAEAACPEGLICHLAYVQP